MEGVNFKFDESLEDIHMVIEAALIERIGEPGKKLHTGRSRNDQVALDLKLWIVESAKTLRFKLHELNKSYVALAGRSTDVVMPSFTHLQRAQPIVAGAEALAWAEMFDRDISLLSMLGNNANAFMPLGSGAIAGSSL